MKTDFITFEKILEKADIEFSASFVHGLFCALCCAKEQTKDWVYWLTDQSEIIDVSQKEALNRLMTIKGEVLEDLLDDSFDFSILIDQDQDYVLDNLALTKDWIAGFLLGFDKAGLQNIISTTSLSFEFIGDLRQLINHLDISETEIDEEAEDHLIEIQEYLKVGAINLYYDCQ